MLMLLLKDTQREKELTIKPSDVLHGDFAVSPDGGDDEVKLVAPQPPVGHAEVLAVHNVAQGTLVHIQHN